MTARVELAGVTKRFGAATALEGVDLRVMPGEVHALLGENGAGKSTLVKVLAGLLRPDAGTMAWDGRAVGPGAARRLPIATVHQHFSLFERMTVLENIALGLPGARADRALANRIRAAGDASGATLDPARPVWSLSVGERQLIEITRCLLQSPDLLIMDEPTSVLTPGEVERLFRLVRGVAAGGCAVLFISHKLEEVRALCHAATVLRGGRVVGRCDPGRETPASLARLMIGAELVPPARTAREPGAVRLHVEGLTLPAGTDGPGLHEVGFSVRAGEIVGVAGVAGNGQAQLFAALSGEAPVPAGAVRIDGRAAGRMGPAARRAAGLCALPEDRLGHAAAPGFDLRENGLLTARRRMGLTRAGVVRRGAATAFATSVAERFGVRMAGGAAGPGAVAARLSGGNLQKFVLGREVMQRPGVLVVAQPSWGVDAGSAARIHAALLELAASGAAVLVISQDLSELLLLSDRLLVMARGRVTAAPAAVSAERLGLMMAGAA